MILYFGSIQCILLFTSCEFFNSLYHQGPKWNAQSHFRAAIVLCFCRDFRRLLQAGTPANSNICTRTSHIYPNIVVLIIGTGTIFRLLENPICNFCLVEFHKYKWHTSNQSVTFFSVISYGNEPETFLEHSHYFLFFLNNVFYLCAKLEIYIYLY